MKLAVKGYGADLYGSVICSHRNGCTQLKIQTLLGRLVVCADKILAFSFSNIVCRCSAIHGSLAKRSLYTVKYMLLLSMFLETRRSEMFV